MHDEALVRALRAGDEEAYEALVREHGPRMLQAARRILRDEEEARDAVQEAFLGAFRAIGSFHGESRLSTWLHRIVVNAALMRRRARPAATAVQIEELLPRFDGDGGWERAPRRWSEAADAPAQREEVRARVRAGVDRLPEGFRDALVLRDLEELSTDEVAQALGLTPGAARVRIHRARQALREWLDPALAEREGEER